MVISFIHILFSPQREQYDHEKTSQRFIDYIFDKYHIDASRDDINFIKDIIVGKCKKYNICNIIKIKYYYRFC